MLPYLGMVGRFHNDDSLFVIDDLIWSLLYCATRSESPPLSYLVPEIHGHKVGLI